VTYVATARNNLRCQAPGFLIRDHDHTSLLLGTMADLPLSKAELIAENALLRHQLIILHRQIKKPRLTTTDRLWFLLLANRLRHWKDALLIFEPETLLHWHRQGFRLFWKVKSRNRGGRPRLSADPIALIQRLIGRRLGQVARENRLWGAPRIRGELLKLGITVATATILFSVINSHHSGGK
jgi:putative transposase